MGLNYIENTRTADTMLWKIPEADKEAMVIKRGIRRGRKKTDEQFENPETPFQALRYKLGLSGNQWALILDSNQSALSHSERGKVIPSVPLAKRMIEEARVRGIAVTLDELYQHVLPLNYTVDEKGMLVKDKKL